MLFEIDAFITIILSTFELKIDEFRIDEFDVVEFEIFDVSIFECPIVEFVASLSEMFELIMLELKMLVASAIECSS